jgi:ribonuclease-3 family protein
MFNLGEKMDKKKANALNPIVLAFVGDAVYSLFIREKLTFFTDCKTGELNKLATKKVNAVAQAESVTKMLPMLNEEELAVFKRARNAKKPTKAKHASVVEYNNATGFEAVIGYLYIIGEIDRLNYLLNLGEENEG